MPVEVANESEIAVDESELAGVCRYVLAEMKVNAMAELSVLCVDVDYMSTLHERWMGEKGPTDVLAFPLDGAAAVAGPRELGDVVICPEHTADLEEAAVHGALHLCGYDHEVDEGEMLEVQARVMAGLRTADCGPRTET